MDCDHVNGNSVMLLTVSRNEHPLLSYRVILCRCIEQVPLLSFGMLPVNNGNNKEIDFMSNYDLLSMIP